MRSGVQLFNSSFIGSQVSPETGFVGGRAALIIDATQYGPNGVIFQLQGTAKNWVPVCSAIVSNQIFSFDAPAGNYRLVSNLGSSLGVGASLIPINYGG